MKKRLRVLELLGHSAGGIARHVSQITKALDGTDRLAVDIAGPDDLPIAMPKETIPLTVPDGPVAGHRAAIRSLRRVIRERGYDVVHAHGLRAGIDASLAATRSGPPVLLTVHNVVRPEVAGALRAALFKWAEPLAVKRSAHTFAVSEDIALHLRALVPGDPGRVETLYLGIGGAPVVGAGREEVRRRLSLSPDERLIVTAARLAPQKAVHILLEALELLPSEVHLAVLGKGPLEEELKGLARGSSLETRVHWLGWQDAPADYMAAADVFCLASVWEGIPLAAQEAIALGVPVVATNVGGLPELVTDGASGRLVEPHDPEALAVALREVLGSDRLRKSYATRARSDLAERFSTERMLTRLDAAYRGWGHGT